MAANSSPATLVNKVPMPSKRPRTKTSSIIDNMFDDLFGDSHPEYEDLDSSVPYSTASDTSTAASDPINPLQLFLVLKSQRRLELFLMLILPLSHISNVDTQPTNRTTTKCRPNFAPPLTAEDDYRSSCSTNFVPPRTAEDLLAKVNGFVTILEFQIADTILNHMLISWNTLRLLLQELFGETYCECRFVPPTPSFKASHHPPAKGHKVVTTKVSRGKFPPNVPSVPIDDTSLHSEDCVRRSMWFNVICTTDESIISNQHRSCTPILDLVIKACLLPNIIEVDPFYHRLLREFIVNLPTDLNDPGAMEHHKVHVRGLCFNISPTLLNSFLKVSQPVDFSLSLLTLELLALKQLALPQVKSR
ncbi:flocculation protein FLO11-like [Cucumis melo var. makuwa]|uniref:Flocculation protein FLO11-like n=1 Tax=Cucumis melo var. makuwa TaxID=1194695 RepID=A0A5D3BYZ7_CUCMM|nr:flocculation protein FLO11-like [Cucumis melo var. makuwa]TYK03289.1 flocculation protein FLO11-like [Cucumis melo var. makuwa]